MAYLIFNKTDSSLYKIAANETDKDNLNIIDDQWTIKDISDSDFTLVKNGEKLVELSGDTVTYTDVNMTYESADLLQEWINNIISLINDFKANGNNQSNPNYDSVVAYGQYLNDFDTSTITYPLDKSWEQYCADTGVTYFNSLQLP
jgi:hypothetical protein|tara:strand:- start:5549 stop:5986 length:438 start_codon:yes stop_codon:yes gene_type:complete